MIAREAEWQREREAVSRQIEMANKSQVIVIDDDTSELRDMSDEDEDGSDVWQAEANESREPTPEVSEIVERPQIVKPRRMQLPSPWRRNSQVVYSDKVEATEADLFWQPDEFKSEPATQNKPHSEFRPDSSNGPASEQQRYHVDGSEDKMSRSESSNAQSLEVPAPAVNCLTPAGHVNHGPAELPKTPEKTYIEDYTESFEGDMSLTPVCDRTVNTFSPVEITAPIDPLLLQKASPKGASEAAAESLLVLSNLSPNLSNPGFLASPPLSGVLSPSSHPQQQRKTSSAPALTSHFANLHRGKAAIPAPLAPSTTPLSYTAPTSSLATRPRIHACTMV